MSQDLKYIIDCDTCNLAVKTTLRVTSRPAYNAGSKIVSAFLYEQCNLFRLGSNPRKTGCK